MKKLPFILALLLGVMSCKSDQEDLYTDGNYPTTFMFDKLSVHFDAKGGKDSIQVGNPIMLKNNNRAIRYTEFVALDKDGNTIDFYVPESDLVNREGIKIYYRPETSDFMIEADPTEKRDIKYMIHVVSHSFQDQIVIKR